MNTFILGDNSFHGVIFYNPELMEEIQGMGIDALRLAPGMLCLQADHSHMMDGLVGPLNWCFGLCLERTEGLRHIS